MTKTSQSVIGVRGLFLLGSKRGQLAGYSDEPGRDHISLSCELDTGYCGIMRRYLNANFRFNIHYRTASLSPDTPTPPGSLGHTVNPERVSGSGFIFVAAPSPSRRRNAALQLCCLSDLQCSFFQRRHKSGNDFGATWVIATWGSGDLTAEFDALFELSVR